MKNGSNIERIDPIEKIRKTVKHLSHTTEYKVLNIFDNCLYFSAPFTYEDFDPYRQIDVIREIDTFAYKQIRKSKNNFNFLYFIGDVKYYIGSNKIYLVGFTQKKRDNREDYFLREGYFMVRNDAISNIFPQKQKKIIKKLLKVWEDKEFIFPACNRVVEFDKNGNLLKKDFKKGDEKFTLQNYCKQVGSAFTYIKNLSKAGETSIIFPILVLGGEIELIIGYPEEIIEGDFSKPKSFYFLFPLPREANYNIPMLITSIENIRDVLLAIEYELKLIFGIKFETFGLLNEEETNY